MKGIKIKFITVTIPVIMNEEKPGYSVTVPAMRGLISEGDTIGEAFKNIKDAAKLFIKATAKECKLQDNIFLQNKVKWVGYETVKVRVERKIVW